MGQTGRNLKQRYFEHIRYIKHNNPQSACAWHIIQYVYEYGPLQDTITLLHLTKGLYMNTLEKFCVQLLKYQNKLIPEQLPVDRNPLFDLVYNVHLQHATTWRNT